MVFVVDSAIPENESPLLQLEYANLVLKFKKKSIQLIV